MKILITGGAGFIGSHLADDLIKKNHNLVLLVRNKSKIPNISHLKNKVSIQECDVRNYPKMGQLLKKHKPSIILHLAGQTSHASSFKKPFNDLETNTKSTLILLEQVRRLDLNCRIILGSTFIVTGKPKKLPINENTPNNPTALYAINRLASEYYCYTYNKIYGLDTQVFRITNSFGPREQVRSTKNAINYMIYHAHLGKPLTIFNYGKFFRDIIYVSDVINGIKTIMRKGKGGNLYWISSGKKTWFYQLGQWLEELTGVKVKYVDAPQYTKKVDVGNFLVDNSKLKSLGWKPSVSVKNGIVKTLNFLKENKL